MKLLFALIGAALGAVLFGAADESLIFAGMVTGLLLGMLLAKSARLEARVRQLETLLANTQPGTSRAATEPPPVMSEPSPVYESGAPTVPDEIAPAAAWPLSPPDRAEPVKKSTPPAPPSMPNGVDRALNWLTHFFTGENAIVRIGIIVLFFGVAFLIKFVADRGILPIEWRLTGVALAALALLGVGWRLRSKRHGYALLLQGGGVGILYLTIFGAFRMYGLIPGALAFPLLVAITGLSGALAVIQNSRSFALFGVAGGFLAPVLTSTGSGQHVALFSYYALLNAGILGIGWYRAWRELNLAGFTFTFVIGVLWGQRYYQPELFASTEAFLVMFFVFYALLAVLFARRQPPDLKGVVDGSLVFGVPIVGFALQAIIVKPYAYGLAFSALALGLFYAGLATVVFRRNPANYRLLAESFLALCVVFGTLTIPLALDARWTAAAWALEGAAIVWVSVRQPRWLGRAFGSLLIIAAGLSFARRFGFQSYDVIFINGHFIGCLLIAVAALLGSVLLYRKHDGEQRWERSAHYLLFIYGVGWWFAGTLHEIDQHLSTLHQHAAVVALFALSALLAHGIGARSAFVTLRRLSFGLAPVLVLLMLSLLPSFVHPFAYWGAAAWAAALTVHFHVLHREPQHGRSTWLPYLHAAGLWAIAGVAMQEAAWLADYFVGGGDAWPVAARGAGLACVMFVVARYCLRARAWPWRDEGRAYLTWGSLPLVGGAVLWSVAANLDNTGNADPLPYVPLLNPLDIAQIFILVSLFAWLAALRARFAISAARVVEMMSTIGALGFLWLNALLLRSLHHLADVPFDWHAMMDSTLVQAALSIFWCAIALPLMVLAARGASRRFWLVGAALLGVTVAKLFFVDLAHTATIARIVSFLAVGGLLLLIGYLAPMPPRTETIGREKPA